MGSESDEGQERKDDTESSNLPETGTADGTPISASPEFEPDGGQVTSTTKTIERSSTTETTTDTFNFAAIQNINDKAAVPTEAIQTQMASLDLSKMATDTRDIVGAKATSATISKVGPDPRSIAHVVSATGKPIDVYVIIDDSESASSPNYKARVKNAVIALGQQLGDANWKMFLGGLSGAADNVIIDSAALPGGLTAAVDGALNDKIFKEQTSGVERIFFSLAELERLNALKDRDLAAHGYFVIADAANCKDSAGNVSGDCKFGTDTAPLSDHRYFLRLSNPNRLTTAFTRHLALLGAYYRITNPGFNGVCSADAGDVAESPLSQFSDASLAWQTLIYGSVRSDFTGDICQEGENNLNFVRGFADALRDLAARRVVLPEAPGAFPEAPQYNLAVVTAANGDAVAFSSPDPRVVRIADAVAVGSDVRIRYHLRPADYLRIKYENAFSPEPDAAVGVSLSWIDPVQGAKSTACVRSASDTAFDTAGVFCRYSVPTDTTQPWSLYLANLTFLPDVGAGAKLDVKVMWTTAVQQIRRISLASASEIYLNTVRITQAPVAAAAIVAGAQVMRDPGDATNVKKAVVEFPAILPEGSYAVQYQTLDLTKQSIVITGTLSTVVANQVVYCALPGAVVTTTGPGLFTIDDPAKYWPGCTLDFANKKVNVSGRVPLAATGKPDLQIVTFASVAPIGNLLLAKLPAAATLKVAVLGPGPALVVLQEGPGFSLQGQNLVLSSPIMPGQALDVKYDYVPPLDVRCFALSGKASVSPDKPAAEPQYQISYGPKGSPPVAAAPMAVSLQDLGGIVQACLNIEPSHGYSLVIRYQTLNQVLESQQTTETEMLE